jgi:hypothetical protein
MRESRFTSAGTNHSIIMIQKGVDVDSKELMVAIECQECVDAADCLQCLPNGGAILCE